MKTLSKRAVLELRLAVLLRSERVLYLRLEKISGKIVALRFQIDKEVNRV